MYLPRVSRLTAILTAFFANAAFMRCNKEYSRFATKSLCAGIFVMLYLFYILVLVSCEK